MDARVMVFLLSVLVTAVSGHAEENSTAAPEGWPNKLEDMMYCLDQENVTQEEMTDFLINQKYEDDNEALKMAVYCFLKRINFFDGVSWNTEVISEMESDNPELLKLINDCVAKDDFKLSAQERSYQVQKCVIENGTIEEFFK